MHPNKTVTRPVLWLMVAVSAVMAGCASPKHRAPVEDRSTGRTSAPVPPATVPSAPAVPADSASPLPGAENAGKPGYYSVKPGDTLLRIALENGQNWRDLVRWNNLENPNRIEVGQVLRVIAPAADVAVSAKPVTSAKVESRPLEARPGASVAASAAASVAGAGSAPAVASVPVAGNGSADDNVPWAWPAAGAVVTQFDEQRNKGLAFAGKAGDPVYAAADGRVVYAGSGLRGYGNLVIIKHNATYLTAYAHNQSLLVKEDQAVRKGQQIAEMGSSDADSVKLHFEVRKQGKPVDPARVLPPR